MQYPQITHINDVLPIIEGCPQFVVGKRDWGFFVDYNYTEPGMFDHPIKLECRGIKFYPDGRLMARPLHKFFNYGETPETTDIDWDQPHAIEDKLDGSMVHGAIVDGDAVLMTRAGITDQAKAAMEFAHKYRRGIFETIRYFTDHDMTIVYEYTAPTNRIVVKYDEPALTPIAIRNNLNGQYFHNRTYWETHSSGSWIVDSVRSMTGKEGVVVKFKDGLWVKIKSDEYVRLHRVKGDLSFEKNVLASIIRGEIDDLIPMMSDDDAAVVQKYRTDVWAGIQTTLDNVSSFCAKHWSDDRKTFALRVKEHLDQRLWAIAFTKYGGADALDATKEIILKACTSTTKLETIRSIIACRWQYNGVASE